MRNKKVSRLLSVCTALALCSGPVAAQQLFAVHSSAEQGTSHSKRVTVTLQHVTLESALETIAKEADVQVVYKSAVIPKRTVSLTAANRPVMEVLQGILTGTELSATVTSGGIISIGQAGEARRAVQGTVIGKVLHAKTKQPVVGATISVGDSATGITTGMAGTFRLSLPAGEHTLRIRAVGFVRQVRKVVVANEQSVSIEVVLEPSASVLDEVVVTGTVLATERKEIPTPITVITAEDIESRGITKIEQLFRGEVPGLLALDHGSARWSSQNAGQDVTASLYARGSASLDGSTNPIKTYVDGVELVDPSYLGTIDPKSIEKIEIVTGPQAATIYGSGAMGGVMQIFTKKGSDSGAPEWQVSLRYGMLQNSFTSSLTPTHDDNVTVRGMLVPGLQYSSTVSYNHTGKWQPSLKSSIYGAQVGVVYTKDRLTISPSFSSSRTQQGLWRYGFSGDYGLLELLTSPDYSYRDYNIAGRYLTGMKSQSNSQILSVTADYQVGPVWQHHLTIGQSRTTIRMNGTTADLQDPGDSLVRYNASIRDRLTWNYNSSILHSLHWLTSALTVGVNGSSGSSLASNGFKVNDAAAGFISTTDIRPTVTSPAGDRVWGGFATWRIGLFSQLYTTLGIRAERNSNYGGNVKFNMTPTNGLTYTMEYGPVSVKLLGSYGRATRAPNPAYRLEVVNNSASRSPSQYISRFANPDLGPEYSSGPQGGVEIYIGNRGSLTVNHYQQVVKDLIQTAVVDSFQYIQLSNGAQYWFRQSQYQNVATVRQIGWEGTGSLNLGALGLRGTWSWNDSRIRSIHPRSTTTYQLGQSFYGVPTHSSSVTVAYAHGPTSLNMTTNYVGTKLIHNSYNRFYWEVYQARAQMYSPMGDYSRLHYYVSNPANVKTNLNIMHRVSSDLSFTVNVTNLTNDFTSDDSELNPTLGRQTVIGVSYRIK